jgi:hypothetical protein
VGSLISEALPPAPGSRVLLGWLCVACRWEVRRPPCNIIKKRLWAGRHWLQCWAHSPPPIPHGYYSARPAGLKYQSAMMVTAVGTHDCSLQQRPMQGAAARLPYGFFII